MNTIIDNIKPFISVNKKAFMYAFDCAKKTDSGFFGKVNTFLEKYKEKKAIIRVSKTDPFNVITQRDLGFGMAVMFASFEQKAAERDLKIAEEEQNKQQQPTANVIGPIPSK